MRHKKIVGCVALTVVAIAFIAVWSPRRRPVAVDATPSGGPSTEVVRSIQGSPAGVKPAAANPPRLSSEGPRPVEAGPATTAEEARIAEFKQDVVRLGEECMKKETCDPRELHLRQVALGFEFKLGKNHPKTARLMDVATWSHDVRQQLGQKFERKEISRKEMFAQLTTHFGEMGKRYGQVLSDEEYQQMFDVEKGTNPAEFFGVSPEMAEQLDKQEALAQQTPPKDETYDDPEPESAPQPSKEEIRQ